jgi:hypothetical protein
MRRAGYPNHSLRCCPMRYHHSCRRCLCAAEGTSPCRTIRIYIHMCLLWEQGRQITMIRVSRDRITNLGGEPQSSWVGEGYGTENSPLASPWCHHETKVGRLYALMCSCHRALLQLWFEYQLPSIYSTVKS